MPLSFDPNSTVECGVSGIFPKNKIWAGLICSLPQRLLWSIKVRQQEKASHGFVCFIQTIAKKVLWILIKRGKGEYAI